MIATSESEDAAFRSLFDLSMIIATAEETVVIGGHMVGIICAAFPAPGLVSRGTQDADAGIPLELASTGQLNDQLLTLGYTAKAGNRYVKGEVEPQPTIDLLIPALDGRFREQIQGGRRFDAMPGLGLAMNPRLRIEVSLTFQDGAEQSTSVMVPGIEAAIILKSFAWADRHLRTQKDAIDLSNLFAVLQHHGPEGVGGLWRLNEPELQGQRRDAAANLHKLADILDSRPPKVNVDTRALVSRIRSWVTNPTQRLV